MKDPIVEEVRRIRREIWEEFNHDPHAYAEYIRERQGKSGHKVVDLSKKRKTG
jgi:hypothetical protein